MDVATFNRYRRTGITKTTKALEALFRAKPQDVVDALDDEPFEGLPERFKDALSALGLNEEELKHIHDWPNEYKEQVRVAVLEAISDHKTVRFAWKLDEVGEEDTIIDRDRPGAIEITFVSPWDNLRALGPDEVDVEANPPRHR